MFDQSIEYYSAGRTRTISVQLANSRRAGTRARGTIVQWLEYLRGLYPKALQDHDAAKQIAREMLYLLSKVAA